MKSPIVKSILCLIASTGALFADHHNEEGFVSLFDGKSLKGWTSAHSKGEGDWGPFRINEKDKAIHVYKGEEANSKQSSDCLNTVKEYSKFIFRMDYRWMGDRYAPRPNEDRDAGLLYHVHGDLKRVWPWSMEMQIGESPGDKWGGKGGRYHTGDLFVLGKHLRCKTTRSKKHYDPKEPLVISKSCKTPLGKENPMGEWNHMELIVDGAKKATFKLNGEVVFELYDMEMEKDGKWVPLEKGHIGVQAEWAEIQYANIRIKELK